MKRLFIIAGCNGSGKTTLSYSVLPELLKCEEFVNADEIARGLSPFNPESAAIQSGRLMLKRINYLIEEGKDFAFETTLATKSFKNLVLKAKEKGYEVTLLYLWLSSEELAIDRVQTRVEEGGHDIPVEVIRRRYINGLKNFMYVYINIVDDWILADNSMQSHEIIAAKYPDKTIINNFDKWEIILDLVN